MNSEEILKIHNVLLDELIEGHGFRGLAKELSRILKQSVIITNLNGRILGVDQSLPIQEGNLLLHSVLDPNVNYCTLSLGNKEKSAVYIKITSKNRKLVGFIFVVTQPDDEKAYLIAQQAVVLCALEFSKHNYILEAQREYKDAFIYDLLYSNIESVSDIMSRGEIWGWNLNRPHGVVVFEMEDFQDYTADSHLLDAFFEIIQVLLQQELSNPILMKKKHQIVVILPEDAHYESRNDVRNFIEKVLKAARERSATRILRVGVGRVYESPKDIFRSFQEAKVALELGRLMEIDGGIPFFSDLGLARILYNHDREELREYYNETLGALERFDREQSNNLMLTLEEYLKNQCDLKTTASSLYLHPNTLRYRLKRIEEVLHVQLDTFDTKLNLMTAFKIKYLKKI
jgi:sugar diacid utilization regulator